ncbi:Flp family type IVb pilin [Rhodopseudomonas palustris]|uniref:Flp/Fap pilin component n=1 Tax=Rhodopseudomonas palustris (strain BisB18) TaxID=316056 RepID=Q217T1_RHOPB
MRRLLCKFLGDRSGATSLEYALIAAGLSIVILGAVQTIGTAVTAKYTSVGSAIH